MDLSKIRCGCGVIFAPAVRTQKACDTCGARDRTAARAQASCSKTFDASEIAMSICGIHVKGFGVGDRVDIDGVAYTRGANGWFQDRAAAYMAQAGADDRDDTAPKCNAAFVGGGELHRAAKAALDASSAKAQADESRWYEELKAEWAAKASARSARQIEIDLEWVGTCGDVHMLRAMASAYRVNLAGVGLIEDARFKLGNELEQKLDDSLVREQHRRDMLQVCPTSKK